MVGAFVQFQIKLFRLMSVHIFDQLSYFFSRISELKTFFSVENWKDK